MAIDFHFSGLLLVMLMLGIWGLNKIWKNIMYKASKPIKKIEHTCEANMNVREIELGWEIVLIK